jgi:stage II sporulation protein D
MGCGGQDAEQPQAPSSVVEPEVRVLLQRGQPHGSIHVRTRAAFRLVDARGDELLAGERDTTATVSVADGGLRWGDSLLGRRRVDLITNADQVVLGGRVFRGRLRFIPTSAGGVAVVNHVPIESYLTGVLRGETPRRFHGAAQRAQAIAARTYALYQVSVSPPEADFDVYAGERSQVYRGVAGEDAKAIEAVRQTRGLVLIAPDGDRRIFEALYSSTCGGATLSASAFSGKQAVGPLRGGILCDHCAAAGSPFLEWPHDVRIGKDEIEDALVSRFPKLASLGPLLGIEIVERGAANRPTMLRLLGEGGAGRTILPEALRVTIGGRRLRSSWFEIETQEEHFVFTGGRGYGHGAGMCQYGAQGMARDGSSALDILAHYYPGSVAVRAY